MTNRGYTTTQPSEGLGGCKEVIYKALCVQAVLCSCTLLNQARLLACPAIAGGYSMVKHLRLWQVSVPSPRQFSSLIVPSRIALALLGADIAAR